LSLISLGYIFTYYFLLISSYSLSHFFSRQALRQPQYKGVKRMQTVVHFCTKRITFNE
jgi:hypothetical protein